MERNQLNGSIEISQQPLLKKPVQKTRLKSIDVYRGLTMAGMTLVNHQYLDPIWPLRESQWNGIITGDLIFPAFLFIMGFAVPLAVRKPFKIWRFLLRVCGIFLFGVLVNSTSQKYQFETLRILGVLHRISLCYFVLVLIHVATNYGEERLRKYSIMFVTILLAIYTGFMVNFTDEANHCDRTNNLNQYCSFQRWLDLKILTQKHIMKPTDPQGIFSTLSAIFTAFGGYYFSLTMQKFKDNKYQLLKRWVIYAIFFILVSLPVSLVMPYNKKLWSSSYAFLTIGISGTALSLVMFTVDILTEKYKGKTYQKTVDIVVRPFLWLGMNPLAIYVLQQVSQAVLRNFITIKGISAFSYFYEYGFHSWIINAGWSSAVYAIVILLFWIIVAYILFRFKIFIKL